MNGAAESSLSPKVIESFLRSDFPFVPTPSQESLIRVLGRFLHSDKENCLLVIKGYAGTGKTSMVRALTQTLPRMGLKFVLLAPTGRAAKVISAYTGKPALTIHKKIYFRQRTASGGTFFVPGANLHTNTVFVVDEASMIGADDYSLTGGGNLLEDLFEYVYNGRNCRLILIGDGAQLPPVGSTVSPALDMRFLKSTFSVTAAIAELSDVTRQKKGSGILELATAIRYSIGKEMDSVFPIRIPSESDVVSLTGIDLQEALEDGFSIYGGQAAVLITGSNKRANQFNREIRARIFYREEEISGGDMIMAVKNNYRWTSEEDQPGFIANGDTMEILRLGKAYHRHGFRFREATVRLTDYPDGIELDLMLWLDALDIEEASMSSKAVDHLYRETLKDYDHLPTKKERIEAIKKDPFYNALQVKFAYAITCHKSQGGQWPVVFVDQGYLTEEMLNLEYLRWLYTAVTRATERLYLVNFSEMIFTDDQRGRLNM